MGFLRRVSVEESFKVSDLLRLAAEHALRLQATGLCALPVDTPVFSGRMLTHEVQPGLTAAVSDLTYLTDHELCSEAGPAVTCGVLLHGEEETMEVCGYGHITRRFERPALFGYCRPKKFRLTDMRGRRTCAAGFMMKPNFFDRFGDTIQADGLAGLREFAMADFRFESLPRSPKIVELARRCLDHPYNGQLGELFLESTMLAFVIEAAELLAHERRMIALLGKRHYDRVMEARDILDANLVKPPKILELTRRVGVNLTTLQANFKTVFGTTIFGYVRTQRLMMARVLLLEHHVSVAEAGYRVGFASPSAFTAAYRRHFGYPPGQDVTRDRG